MDYVGDGKYTTCGHVDGVARQKGYPELCLFWFLMIYTGRQSWDDLSVDLNKAAEKEGFQFTVHNTKHAARATAWKVSCKHHRMFED
jgi:hypothetical protein